MRTMPVAQSVRGFSLLEALVALVVIAGIGSVVYGWINTNLIAVERSRNAIDRSEAVAAALTVMDDVNPMQSPRGRADYGGYRIRWTSSPVEQPRQGVSRTGEPGLYRVGLYRIQIEVARPQAPSVSFAVRQTGYRQLGASSDEPLLE